MIVWNLFSAPFSFPPSLSALLAPLEGSEFHFPLSFKLGEVSASSARTATCPLLNTVSTGSFTKSSMTELAKVAKLYVPGATTGSTEKVLLSSNGVEDEITVGNVACNNVGAANFAVSVHDRKLRSAGQIVRGFPLFASPWTGVTIRRVRIRSSGASTAAAIPAAATATLRDNKGELLSTISSPPMPEPPAPAPTSPGSGIFNSAAKRLRIHDSDVLSRKLYTKVTFVAFQTPQADSWAQSWEMTSRREAGWWRANVYARWGRPGLDCVGVEVLEREGVWRARRDRDVKEEAEA